MATTTYTGRRLTLDQRVRNRKAANIEDRIAETFERLMENGRAFTTSAIVAEALVEGAKDADNDVDVLCRYDAHARGWWCVLEFDRRALGQEGR